MTKITEKVAFSSSLGDADDTLRTYDLNISKTPKGFTLVINNIGSAGKGILFEEYETLVSKGTSDMDGIWKLVSMYWLKGKDTTRDNLVQYKAYYGGHFIWGHSVTDSSDKKHTGVGFGTFKMNGQGKLSETVERSTYSVINGLTMDVAISKNGPDRYIQRIIGLDGDTQVEEYERVKN